jgi:hypothetical protein
MIPEEQASSRRATPAELERLKTARAALRRSALWVGAVAIVLPTGLAVVITASTLRTFPGSWSQLLLGLLLGYAAIFGIFTGSMLLHETGHALASSRRLARDAAGGFRVVREHGEVKWGKRSYVAVVGGRRLFSPYFTDLASVPGFWRHFDRLTPGRYRFELLAESGLVLSAERDVRASDHPAFVAAAGDADDSPLDVALLAAFRNRAADRALNRRGLASRAQRWRLVVAYAWVVILLPFLGLGAWLGEPKRLRDPTAGGWVGVVIVLLIGGFALQLAVRIVLDVIEGRVDSKVGRTTFRFGKTDATGSIGGRSFTLSNRQTRALYGLPHYRVYFFRRTHRVAGAESAGPS